MRRCREVAAGLTTADAMRRFEAERVPCGVVVAPADLLEDAHAISVGMLVEDTHPAAGRIRQPRHPTQFLGTPARVAGAAPTIGQHTDAIIGELGLADRAADLRARGVVA